MMPVKGSYFDGLTAGRHDVNVVLSDDQNKLILIGKSLDGPTHWPLNRLRALSDRARLGRMTLTLHCEIGDEAPRVAARLTISDKALRKKLKTLCPDLRRKDLHQGSWQKILKRVSLAIGAVGLMLFFILPRMADTLAELIPVEREISFGKSVTQQIELALGATNLGDLDCRDADGLNALGKMLGRLVSAQALEYELEVRVLDHGMINAFAAPGGQIVVMRGLLDYSSSPEAVASVLAHEIGHVERRDATRHALRAAGSAGLLSLVLGDVTGGAAAVFLGNQVLEASYTRESEAEADQFALAMLNSAAVNSTGMAEFFEFLHGLEGEGPGLPSYFSTHPASNARAERARLNAATQGITPPILSASEWRDLRAVCG